MYIIDIGWFPFTKPQGTFIIQTIKKLDNQQTRIFSKQTKKLHFLAKKFQEAIDYAIDDRKNLSQ